MTRPPQPEAEESDTRQRIRAMSTAGLTVAEMAMELGITRQRVHQQLKRIRETDERKVRR